MNVIVSNKYQTMLQTLNVDVIKSVQGEFNVDEIIAGFQNFYFQRMILDITSIKDYKDIKNIQKLSMAFDMNKIILLLDDSPEINSNQFLSKLISMGIYNFTNTAEGIMYLYNNPNSYRDVAHIQQFENQTNIAAPTTLNTVGHTRIIGIKGVTKESGSTTLTYLMKQELEKHYKVAAIEVDKRDFMFLRGENLVSTTSVEIGNTIIKYNNCDAVVIDVNGSSTALDLCEDVIYLIEPSTIKLNRLMLISAKTFKNLADKKIVLNKSVLSNKDVRDFEYESRLKVLYNMPPLDEREKSIPEVAKFLNKLGFDKCK